MNWQLFLGVTSPLPQDCWDTLQRHHRPKVDTQSHMPPKTDLFCVSVMSRSTAAESQGVMGSLPRGSDSRQLPALHGALPDPQLV